MTLGVPAAASTTSVVTTIAGGGLADGGQASASNLTWADDIALELSLNHELACSPLPFDMPGYEVHMCWHRRDDNNPSAAWFRDLVRRVGGEDAQRARADAAS